jgi:phage host-nuclease inhibitor protein Gam
VADTLEAIDFSGQFEGKADSYAQVIRQLEYDAEAAKTEAKRIADHGKTFEQGADKLKQRLFEAMKQTGKEKFKTPFAAYSIRKNAAAVQIADDAAIPDEYFRTKREVDKAAIKEAIKAGAEIAGCALVQGESLQIK